MTTEQAIAAKELLVAAGDGTQPWSDYNVRCAQVHAALAVAEQLELLIRVLRDRERP